MPGFSFTERLCEKETEIVFEKVINERKHMADDPLIFSLRLAIGNKTSTGRYIEGLLTAADDCLSDGLKLLKNQVLASEKNKI